MIKQIKAYEAKCNLCGKGYTEGDFSIFLTIDDLTEHMGDDGWYQEDDLCLCDDCHELDDEGNLDVEELVDYLKKRLIESTFVSVINAEHVYSKENPREEIAFYQFEYTDGRRKTHGDDFKFEIDYTECSPTDIPVDILIKLMTTP